MQVKLLRAIQEKKVRKVGATTEEPVDVRIISATHKKLPALVDAGEFRQDLFYRLHVIELGMPSLREMREDIPYDRRRDPQEARARHAARLDAEAVTALEAYPFPGNVRELENILERGLSLAADSLEDHGRRPAPDPAARRKRCGDAHRATNGRCRTISIGLSASAINEALEKTRYNRTAAAKLLGITFRAMRYRMERLGIK